MQVSGRLIKNVKCSVLSAEDPQGQGPLVVSLHRSW